MTRYKGEHEAPYSRYLRARQRSCPAYGPSVRRAGRTKAPLARSAAAGPEKKLGDILGAMWTTVLETPSPQNPFGGGPPESACIDLGGTVAPFGPNGVATCTVKPGTKILSQQPRTSAAPSKAMAQLRPSCVAVRRRRPGRPDLYGGQQVRVGNRGGDETVGDRPSRRQYLHLPRVPKACPWVTAGSRCSIR